MPPLYPPQPPFGRGHRAPCQTPSFPPPQAAGQPERFSCRAPQQAAGTPQGDRAPEHAHRRLDQSGLSSLCVRLHNLTGAAQALGLHLHVVEVRRADELDTAFAAMTRAGADAVIVIEDAVLLNSERGRVVADLAATHRLPVMYGWREWVVAGCLMSYGPSRPGLYRRATIYVDKILKGANPAELPVEQATTFELVINLKTAQALGVTIPPPSSSKRPR